MKKFVTLIFLMICCLISKAQLKPTVLTSDGKGVILDISVYRKLREKNYDCDTSILIKDKLLKVKDSTISILKQKTALQQQLITEKDTTISKLIVNNDKTIEILKKNNKKENSIFHNTPVWIGSIIGLIVGVLLVR